MSTCHNESVTTDDVRRLGHGARARRGRRHAGESPTAGRSRTSASAARAGSSGGCASRRRTPRCRVIRSGCSTARAASSRRRSATTRPSRRDPGRPRPAAALHLARRLRGAAREARRARARARRAVPRARRREPARRPRGGGPIRRRLLRQEHDADHAAARLVGRARHARHRGRARADAAARRRLRLVHALHRRLPDGRARRAGDARRDPLPLVLDAGARADPRDVPCGARRAGLRLRHLPGRLPLEPRRRAAPRRTEPPDDGAHVDLVAWLARRAARRTCSAGSTCRATTPRWLRRNALVALGNTGGPDAETRRVLRRYAAGRRRAARRARDAGRSGGWRSDAAERHSSAGSRSSGWSSCRSCSILVARRRTSPTAPGDRGRG